MNREIKFRFFVKYTKKIFEAGKIDMQHKRIYQRNHSSSYYLLDDVKLMQFTGLHDKNGKEIYEGDIVLYKDWEMAYEGGGYDSFINKGIIEYIESNCCFNVTERQTIDIADVLYEDNETLEVIRKYTRKSRVIRRRIEMLKINPKKDIKELEKFRI